MLQVVYSVFEIILDFINFWKSGYFLQKQINHLLIISLAVYDKLKMIHQYLDRAVIFKQKVRL